MNQSTHLNTGKLLKNSAGVDKKKNVKKKLQFQDTIENVRRPSEYQVKRKSTSQKGELDFQELAKRRQSTQAGFKNQISKQSSKVMPMRQVYLKQKSQASKFEINKELHIEIKRRKDKQVSQFIRKRDLRKRFRKAVSLVIHKINFIKFLKKRSIQKQLLREAFHKRFGSLPIYPYDNFKTIWDIVLILTLLVTAYYVPYRIAFIEIVELRYVIFDFSLDFIFFIDIIINFLTCYIDENNNLKRDYKDIAKNYITGWFIVDFVSIIPFDYISMWMNDTNESQGFNKMLRLLRIPRLYKLIKFIKLSQQKQQSITLNQPENDVEKILQIFQTNVQIRQLAEIIFTSILLTHIFTCIWFFLSRYDDHSPDTWAAKNQIAHLDIATKYLYSSYWAVQTITSVGYGDLAFGNFNEYLIAIVWMLFGVVFYSIFIGNLSQIISQTDCTYHFEESKLNFQNLKYAFKITKDVEKKVEKVGNFMNYNFVHNAFWVVRQQSWVQDLPIKYKKMIILFIFKKVIKTVYFFRLNINLTFELLPNMSIIRMSKKEFVFRQGDPADEIYFLLEGEIQYRNQFASQLLFVNKGQLFGEQEFFSQKRRVNHDQRKYYAYCQTDVILIFFESKIFFEILEKCPQLLDWVSSISQAREDKIQKKQTIMKQQRELEQMQRLQWEKIRNANNLYDTAYNHGRKSKQAVIYENSFTFTNRIISELINVNIRKKIQCKKRFQKVVRMVIFANRSIHREVCHEKITRRRRQMPKTLLMTQMISQSNSKTFTNQTNSTYLNTSNNMELSRILQERFGSNKLKNFKTIRKQRKLISIKKNGMRRSDDLTKIYIHVTTGKRVRSTNLEQSRLEKMTDKLQIVKQEYEQGERVAVSIGFNKQDVEEIMRNLKEVKKENEVLGLSKWRMVDARQEQREDMDGCVELIGKLQV